MLLDSVVPFAKRSCPRVAQFIDDDVLTAPAMGQLDAPLIDQSGRTA